MFCPLTVFHAVVHWEELSWSKIVDQLGKLGVGVHFLHSDKQKIKRILKKSRQKTQQLTKENEHFEKISSMETISSELYRCKLTINKLSGRFIWWGSISRLLLFFLCDLLCILSFSSCLKSSYSKSKSPSMTLLCGEMFRFSIFFVLKRYTGFSSMQLFNWTSSTLSCLSLSNSNSNSDSVSEEDEEEEEGSCSIPLIKILPLIDAGDGNNTCVSSTGSQYSLFWKMSLIICAIRYWLSSFLHRFSMDTITGYSDLVKAQSLMTSKTPRRRIFEVMVFPW